MSSDQLAPYISDYLLDQVSDEIRTAIDQLMQSDEEFRKMVEVQRDMQLAASLFGENGLTEKIQQLKEEEEASSGIRIRPIWMIAVAAAVIVILIAISLFSDRHDLTETQSYLATAYPDQISKIYQQLVENQGFSNTEEVEILLSGMQLYQNQEFDAARKQLANYLKLDSANAEAMFYRAEIDWKLGDTLRSTVGWFEVAKSGTQLTDAARLRLLAFYVSVDESVPADSLYQLLESTTDEDIQTQLRRIW